MNGVCSGIDRAPGFLFDGRLSEKNNCTELANKGTIMALDL